MSPGRRLLLACLCLLGAGLPSASAAAATCDLYAAPTGSAGATGTAEDPFPTVQRLADVAQPGQTGCLSGDTFVENPRIVRPGFTLTSAPGERATIKGRIRLLPGADGVTITRLDIDGRNTQGFGSPVILADDATISHVDLTNHHTGICLIAGAFHWGDETPDEVAENLTISHSRIHDCGRLPVTNQDHGLYLENTLNARITDNVIYDNADRGIQLYPNTHGALISGNIIDGNGVGIIFSGEYGASSSNNVVEHNLITNPTVRAAVESWYPSGTPAGTGNVVRSNCVAGARRIELGSTFSVLSNLLLDPLYADRAAKDFRLRPGSPCAGLFSGSTAPAAADALVRDAAAAPLPAPAPIPSPVPAPALENVLAVQTSSTIVTVKATVTGAVDPQAVPAVTTLAGDTWKPARTVRWKPAKRKVVARVRISRRSRSVRVRVRIAGRTAKTHARITRRSRAVR